jgi:hypothetical protein
MAHAAVACTANNAVPGEASQEFPGKKKRITFRQVDNVLYKSLLPGFESGVHQIRSYPATLYILIPQPVQMIFGVYLINLEPFLVEDLLGSSTIPKGVAFQQDEAFLPVQGGSQVLFTHKDSLLQSGEITLQGHHRETVFPKTSKAGPNNPFFLTSIQF